VKGGGFRIETSCLIPVNCIRLIFVHRNVYNDHMAVHLKNVEKKAGVSEHLRRVLGLKLPSSPLHFFVSQCLSEGIKSPFDYTSGKVALKIQGDVLYRRTCRSWNSILS
jgi:hypothetical protein